MMLATRPGTAAADVLRTGQQAYERVGFPGEWRYHHQGGAIGYRAREYIANPDCPEVVTAGQAFAWNPSIRGTKSEDTILVADDGTQVLTAASPHWPCLEIEVDGQVARRPDMLVK